MPTYEYLCEIVNQEFETDHSIKIELEECQLCKEANRTNHKPKRLISGGSGKGIVEQTINEFKEALPNEIRKIKQRASRDENYLANIVGSKYRG